MSFAFRKMNGLGNDFVVLDARAKPIAISEDQARAIADRKTGIGCDQLIVMEKSSRADVRMRIWNAEGGEVQSCGNASRCIADLLFDENKTDTVTIDTKGGLLIATKAGDKMVTVDQGVPKFGWKDIPLSEPFADTRHIELQYGPIDAIRIAFSGWMIWMCWIWAALGRCWKIIRCFLNVQISH
jgi:diaminopimelate epimerase